MNDVLFQPHPGAQQKFMSFKGRYALFGGAKGGGKSQCLLYDPFRQISIEQERVNRGEIRQSTGRAIFFRRTMPELREVINRAKRSFELIDPGVEWVEQAKTFTFSCGYQYVFGQMEEDGDWIKYYGLELTECIFDELTLFTEEQFDQLDTCLRSTDPVLKTMLYMRAGTNPVGPGVEWVRRRFVECAPPGVPVVRRVKTPIIKDGAVVREEIIEHEQIFIPAKVSDNPSIDQAAYSAILSSKSPTVRRQLLEGDWYVTAGSLFGDLWDQSVHVCKPFKIPSGWYKFRGGDYGYSYPGLSSVQWVAVDTDGNFVVYRSLTVTGLNSFDLGQAIRNIEMEAGEWDMHRDCSKLTGPLDHACWAEAGHIGPTIAEGMINQGVFWQKCDKSREAAAEQIRIRLARRSPHPTIKNKDGSPALIIPGVRWFDTCWNWVRRPGGTRIKVGPIITIPVIPADESRPDVWDTDANDHDTDCFGYICLSRPMIPTNDNAVETYRDDEDELAERRRKGNNTSSAWASGGYW